ncbi:aldo/keto reductase family protein [Flammeovirgaceae bacterium 311]|nr:aldo/keto reductase family protein [Flammeovirgaceae bacterium 311]
MQNSINRRQMILSSFKAAAGCLLIPAAAFASNTKPDVMAQPIIHKTIPSTGEKIPAIGMGTWQTFDVGSAASKRAGLEEILKIFVESGGKMIDSSPMYGSSEEVVGALAQKLGLHPSLFVATKVWTSGEEAGIQQMNNSIELLKTPKLDLMQVHNLVDYKTHLNTLKAWKEEGKIRYIGITHYTTGSYPDLMRVMKEYAVDFVQFNYSIQTREAEKTILPFAADRGVAVIINRPFEGGSLFTRTRGKELPDWAAEIGCRSWSQFFLKYIISHPAVSCAIPATDKPHHLKDNMAAMYGHLPDAATRTKMLNLFKNI